MMKKENNQYYWFSPEELSTIQERVMHIDADSQMIDNILAEMKIADIRSDTSNIPMSKLGNALGLEAGSKPLWLSVDEYDLLKNLII